VTSFERKFSVLEILGEGIGHEDLGLALLIRVRSVFALVAASHRLLHLQVEHLTLFHDFNQLVLLLADLVLLLRVPSLDLSVNALLQIFQSYAVNSSR